jgi:hypothetical protein
MQLPKKPLSFTFQSRGFEYDGRSWDEDGLCMNVKLGHGALSLELKV